MRKIDRKRSPLAAGAMFGEQRVDDRTEIDFGQTPALRRRDGDERRDGSPLRIGQIRLHHSSDRVGARVSA